jgi:probable rRNA maturation factor
MNNESTDITVQITSQIREPAIDTKRYEALTRSILKQFAVDRAVVSIAIVDDERIIEINSRFLDRTTATDVISFDLSDEGDDCRTFDIVINADQASRQANDREHSVCAELALYITHGMLHNLGFDDADEEQAKKMHAMEDQILQDAGFGKIYGT